MSRKIGFIGSGNMGSAIIGGILGAGLFAKEDIYVSDVNETSLQSVERCYGVHVTTDNVVVAQNSDILILSVKPQFYQTVITQIRDAVKENVVVVAIAAGKSIAAVREMFQKEIKVARVMPNTPALVGAGMAALTATPDMTGEETDEIVSIFNSFGKCEKVPEHLMDAVTAVSGSGPAYIYMIIEAMADGAVCEGLPRVQAYQFAAQTVLGAAKMVLETGKHPGELKDMVCSPGGTTIAAVRKLEETGLRNSLLQAMKACADKSREMSKG